MITTTVEPPESLLWWRFKLDVDLPPAQRRRRRPRRKSRELILLPDFHSLVVKSAAAGEKSPGDPDRWDYPLAWDVDGTPIYDELRYEDFRDRLNAAGAIRAGRTTLYRGGIRIDVSTVFLRGTNWNTDTFHPPLLWETEVYVGGPRFASGIDLTGDRGAVRQWRYTSRLAATIGHQQIVAALRAGQLRRRASLTRLRRPPQNRYAG